MTKVPGLTSLQAMFQQFHEFHIATTFLLLRWFVLFVFSVFPDAFLLTLSITGVSPQSVFDGVRLRLQKFPRIQWAIFVAGAQGVRTLCFIGRRHDQVDIRFDEVR